MRKWVVDASPLIVLAKVDAVRLLYDSPDELVIPAPVAEEAKSGPEDDPSRRWLLGDGNRYVRPQQQIVTEVASWDLGRGEIAVLSWAHQEPDWTAIVDDLAARRCAQALGISHTGTLGVILTAKANGLISEVGPLLERLVQAGLRLSDDLILQAKRLAGEL